MTISSEARLSSEITRVDAFVTGQGMSGFLFAAPVLWRHGTDAGGCGGCEPGHSIMMTHQRILAHLQMRVERIAATETCCEHR
jgi:hypothetical protein